MLLGDEGFIGETAAAASALQLVLAPVATSDKYHSDGLTLQSSVVVCSVVDLESLVGLRVIGLVSQSVRCTHRSLFILGLHRNRGCLSLVGFHYKTSVMRIIINHFLFCDFVLKSFC